MGLDFNQRLFYCNCRAISSRCRFQETQKWNINMSCRPKTTINPQASNTKRGWKRLTLTHININSFWHGWKSLNLIPSCGRHLCCTRQRMQLVVMAAVLALAGAGQGCSFGCQPTSISIPVESCGRTEFVNTSVCAGQCYHEVTKDSYLERTASQLFCL